MARGDRCGSRRRARLRDGAWRRGARRGGALEPPTPCLARAANPSYGRCSNVVVANYWCVRNVRQCFLLPCPACSSATSGDGRDDELALIDTSKLIFADESLFWDVRRESKSARDASCITERIEIPLTAASRLGVLVRPGWQPKAQRSKAFIPSLITRIIAQAVYVVRARQPPHSPAFKKQAAVKRP